MSIPGSANPLLLASAAEAGAYQIERSVRCNSADSAYLSRTPASAGDRKTWTWAGWVKLANSNQYLFTTTFANANSAGYLYYSGNKFNFWDRRQAADEVILRTNAVFRDPSAWYHIVLSVNYSASVSSDRAKLYVNGIEQTYLTATYPNTTDDSYFNAATAHYISSFGGYVNGYLADIHFIDGQALTPSSFTEVSATTGQLIPKAYTGSFGTNGFWLKFSDNSAATATTLGKDYSGNSNNWTPNNLSVTAGAGNDSLVDTPTSYGTGNSGGDVRGNFCTWNPLSNTTNTITNGNLDIASAAGNADTRCNSTISVSSGKWYYEITLTGLGTNSSAGIGQNQITGTWPGSDSLSYAFELDNARTANNSVLTTYGSALAVNDVFMCAFDLDNSKIFFGKNGTWFNSSNPASGTNPAFTLAAGTYNPIARPYNSNTTGASFAANFGQRAFAYTAPSGFKALCDTNLAAPVVAKPSEVFQAKTYQGTGSTQSVTGLLFSPDLVWIKDRTSANYHTLQDIVRGATKDLYSNTTDAEGTYVNSLNAFNSDGFTIGNSGWVNTSSATYAAWCWDAGTSTVTNTQGSITSQVRANASAGFSIVTYTGTGSNATVGHGLGVAPDMVVYKTRTGTASNWIVYHRTIGGTGGLQLNVTSAAFSDSTPFNGTNPTSNVLHVGTNYQTNSAVPIVAYCFAPVAGYSSFGSYTGNGSTDGPFVYTGFRPRWVMWKPLSSGTDWVVRDAARDSYNIISNYLLANSSAAEGSIAEIDFLSNGFKFRNNLSGNNTNGVQVIYACFAESPFQYARAR